MANAFVRASGKFFFRHRNAVFPVFFVLVFFAVRPSMAGGSPETDRALMIAGVAIALLGQFLRLFVIGFDYIDRGGRDGKVFASRLVVDGLYAHCRNPMYVANIMMAAGMSLLYGSAWMVLVLGAFVFIYLAIVEVEEEYLGEKFGEEYTSYCARVPRFHIRFAGMRHTLGNFTYDWRKALRKEYGTLCATLGGLVLLVVWKMHLVYGQSLTGSDTAMAGLLLLPIALLYGLLRYLKKCTSVLNSAAESAAIR